MKKLFTLMMLLFSVFSVALAAEGTINAASTEKTGSTPANTVEQEGVGRLMKNKTGSSTWSVDDNGDLKTGSSMFALQTYHDIKAIKIYGNGGGSNRTLKTVEVCTTETPTDNGYSEITCTTEGSIGKTDSELLTIIPSETIKAQSYVAITFSGNVTFSYVTLVYAEEDEPGVDNPSGEVVSGTATYALKEGETHTSGETVDVKNTEGEVVATLTFGFAGGKDFSAAKANNSLKDAGFTAFTEGNGDNGKPDSGTTYIIKPQYDGSIQVGVVLNAGKELYVLENGTALEGFNGLTEAEKVYKTYTFDVTGGKTYTVYCGGSKLGFYGFNYTYEYVKAPEEEALAVPVFEPESGAEVIPGQAITITTPEEDGVVYWMDMAYEQYGFEEFAADACLIPANAKAGTTVTFKAKTVKGDKESEVVEAVYTVVAKALADPELKWVDGDGKEVSEATYNMADADAVLPNLSFAVETADFRTTSTDEKVAVYDLSEMKISVKGEGTTTISVSVAESSDYKAATAELKLTVVNVEKPTIPAGEHTYVFYNWSDATVANLKADAAAGADKGWSDDEKNKGTTVDNKCFWMAEANDVIDEDGNLTANGEVIAELKGLDFSNAPATRNLAIAVDYPEVMGKYEGGSYLWLGGSKKDYFVMKGVKAGTTIKIGVESHKLTAGEQDARGVELYVTDDGKTHGEKLMGVDGNAVVVPTTYENQEWKVPGEDGTTVDVLVYNTNGCHIYYIDVEQEEVVDVPEVPEIGDGEIEGPTTVWPVNGAKMLPVEGTIYLEFAEDVEAGGAATLNDVEAPIYADGKVVTIPYKGLELNKEYTLTIPAKQIGNDKGGNKELTYTFTTTDVENLLFYSDFKVYPREYFDECYDIDDNYNIIAKGSTDVTKVLGGLTFYSGTKGRVVALKSASNSTTVGGAYGPFTEDDLGASDYCAQLIDGGKELYVEFAEVEGPVDVTLYLCDADGNGGKVVVTDETGDKSEDAVFVKNFDLSGAKCITKHTFTYPYNGPVRLRLYNENIKVDINDVIIAKSAEAGVDKPAAKDEKAPVVESTYPGTEPYVPVAGKILVKYNEPVVFTSKATVGGVEFDIEVEGNVATVNYSGLENSKEYKVVVPAAADEAGNVAEAGVELTINTIAADILYYTDYDKYPVDFYEKYNHIPNALTNTDNEDMFTEDPNPDKTVSNQTKEVGGITYFSGIAGRVVVMGKSNLMDAVDADSEGATARCIQLIGGSNKLYLELPEVEGPCTLTFWTGNPVEGEAGKVTVKNGEDTELATLSYTADKKITKHVVTYTEDGKAKLRIYNSDNKLNIYNIIVEKGDKSGIENVVVEGGDAVYYNLQGVRVNNPANGFYIRVQGKDVQKVYVK